MRLVLFALSWAAGIVFAAALPSRIPLIWIIACAVGVAFVAMPAFRRWRMPLVLALAFAAGALRLSFIPTGSPVAAYNESGGLTIHGMVVDAPDTRDTATRLRVAAETVTQSGQTLPTAGLVLVESAASGAQYGDRVSATGLLTTPGEFDTFSYTDYLARSGVHSLLRNASLEIESGGYANPIVAALFDVRRRAADTIAAAIPEPEAGLLTGILLGSERGISPDTRDDFAATGAAHVIAISGFNMVVVAETVRRLLKMTPLRPGAVSTLSIGVVLLYSLFVGFSGAVARAALMATLFILAEWLRRKTYVPASLAFAALVITLFDPMALWDVGFQLSFAATLGIALFAEPFTRALKSAIGRLLPSASGVLAPLLAVTLAAQVTATPLIVLYFGRLSLVFLVVNLLILPVQPYILLTGALATLASIVSPIAAQALYWLAFVPLTWTVEVVRGFARLPFAEADISVHPTLIAGFFLIVAGGSLVRAAQPDRALRLSRLIRHRLVASAVLFAGIAVAALSAAIFVSRPDGKLHFWLLDVGHSHAVLVQTPDGAHILVDGGRFPSRLLTSIGDRLPFNDRAIEVFVLTQPDPFEIGGAAAVVARYDMPLTLTNGQESQDDSVLTLMESLGARGSILPVSTGYALELSDGARLDVLHPQTPPALGEPLDAGGLVLRLSYGDVSFLIPSDLDQRGQRAMLDAATSLESAVLILPQHGTVGSLDENFLRAVQPQVALVQAERANRRGDPHPDVLAMLGDLPIFRTDQQGALHLWTDGETLWVQGEQAS